MRTINSIKEMQFYAKKMNEGKKRIGFVPTMGYFHEGHLSLMREAHLKNDITVVSIFVNPKQFGENEDLNIYPRDLERDQRLAMEVGVDILFVPNIDEIYPENYCTYVDPGEISNILCGSSRKRHFIGVATIVNKLFNLVRPHTVYLGQKDFQQSVIIKKMVEDLNMDIETVVMPTVREKDGLALSSRNIYLSEEERIKAKLVFKSLQDAKAAILKGEKNSANIIEQIKRKIEQEAEAGIDYISIVDKITLESRTEISGEIVIALAVFIGKTRLIDNIFLEIK